ncbi:HAD-IIIC family phosphatase [Sporofaciens musculi]|uniref:HAD-IIIC family phosphatase n=1 Tax=Sporofaciens musculi TaxID=2681861 RepID=UPI0025A2E172|nr:HAD-IIIC family phosphatase [Sporofaciens musculi]
MEENIKKTLEYPFQPQFILSKKKKIKRELLKERHQFENKKVAVLGGSTTHDIIAIIELFLLAQGIRPEFYESEYNGYYTEAVFDNPALKEFHPDIVYIYTTNRNIDQYPDISMTNEQVETLIHNTVRKFTDMWESLTKEYHCPIIQNNFEMPCYRLLGNREVWDIHGAVNFLSRVNEQFYQYAQNHKDFFICDINYISADFGLQKWHDPLYWYMYKYALSLDAIPTLAFNVSNMIKSIFGKNKKGFVLDLDHTLWGGVIGDDGIEEIKLGPEEPEGEAYWEFQRYLKQYKDLGILLNIDSKNERANALLGIKHPNSLLKESDFISIQANWNPKSENFLKIAKELNLLPESLVFVDDHPAERAIIEHQIEGVSAPEIGHVQEYIRIIDRSGFFEVTTLSEDDTYRNEMYRKNAERTKAEASFKDYNEYLCFLNMSAEIAPFTSIYIPRITQLTNKSNQFNLTAKRYTQSEIESISADENFMTAYGKLMDRFGDNGVVSVIIGEIKGDECHICLWLMSCRVLKRNMEFAMMDYMVERCKEQGIHKMVGYYHPTKKNEMVREFYGELGFFKTIQKEDGDTVWEYEIPEVYIKRNTVIKEIQP